MKKVVYIGILAVGLALVSCSKQDIQPSPSDPVVPVWKSNTAEPNNGGIVVNDPNGNGTITDPEIDDGTITDPEIDD